MSAATPTPPVVVGSRWRARDPRQNGRTVEVVHLTGQYAMCRRVYPPGAVQAGTGSRLVRILARTLTDRFWCTSTAEAHPLHLKVVGPGPAGRLASAACGCGVKYPVNAPVLPVHDEHLAASGVTA